MRFVLLVFVLLQISCGRVQNAISVSRLDCGSEASWQEKYLRFIDGAGRPLAGNQIEYRSLDGQSASALRLSSKGCLTIGTSGLWLVRHLEKPEGVIVDFSKSAKSSFLQFQDTSAENLKPICPPYEAGQTLDLSSVLGEMGTHDFRGYDISFTIKEAKIAKNWPTANFSLLQKVNLFGIFPEGELKLDLVINNHYRGGEQSTRSCTVKFDSIGPTISGSFLKEPPRSYRNRIFYAISSEQDIRFESAATDFTAIDLCVQSRKDWDAGMPVSENLPHCSKIEKIAPDQPLPFGTRQGFWQIQFRGVDPAGNTSDWSPPYIVLVEQRSIRQSIVAKSVSNAGDVEIRGMDATTTSLVKSLDVFRDWKSLPTAYEREQLEPSILLNLHRAWFQPVLKFELKKHSDLQDSSIAVWPLLGGKKLFYIDINLDPSTSYLSSAKILDLETYEEKTVLTDLGPPDLWDVSSDGKRFFWTESHKIYYGTFVGDNVHIEIKTFDTRLAYARFINGDQQLAVLEENFLQTYDAGDQLSNPIRTPLAINLMGHNWPTIKPMAADGRGILISDPEINDKMVYSLFDAEVKKPFGFRKDLLPNFVMGDDEFKVLKRDDDIIIRYSYNSLSLYNYYRYDSQRPDKMSIYLEGVPFISFDDFMVLDDKMWLSRTGEGGAFLQPGLDLFRSKILEPGFPIGPIESTQARVVSDSGNWMVTGSTDVLPDSENQKRMRVWQRSASGEYNLKMTVDTDCEDNRFQFDEVNLILYSSCDWKSFYVWNLAENSAKRVDEILTSNSVTSLKLIGKQLLVGTDVGEIEIYDLNGMQAKLNRTIKAGKRRVWRMAYDQPRNRLYSVDDLNENPIVIWNASNWEEKPQTISASRRGTNIIVLSSNLKYLASSSFQDFRIHVRDADNLIQDPAILAGNSKAVQDLGFFGDSSFLVSATRDGIVKLWDVKNPDMPPVTFRAVLAGQVFNVAGVPDRNEFVVETNDARMYQYHLDTMPDILKRTCSALRIHFHYNPNPQLEELCTNP